MPAAGDAAAAQNENQYTAGLLEWVYYIYLVKIACLTRYLIYANIKNIRLSKEILLKSRKNYKMHSIIYIFNSYNHYYIKEIIRKLLKGT